MSSKNTHKFPVGRHQDFNAKRWGKEVSDIDWVKLNRERQKPEPASTGFMANNPIINKSFSLSFSQPLHSLFHSSILLSWSLDTDNDEIWVPPINWGLHAHNNTKTQNVYEYVSLSNVCMMLIEATA